MTWSGNERTSRVLEGNGNRQYSYPTLSSQITAIRDASRTKPEHAETGHMSITLQILWSPRPCRTIGNTILGCQSITECVQGRFFLLQRREQEPGEQKEAMDAVGPGAKARARGGDR